MPDSDTVAYNFFERQNIWLKAAILLLGSLSAAVLPLKALTLLLLLTFSYCLPTLSLLPKILQGLKIILPFLTVYSVLAALTRVELPLVITFIMRILCLLILVVYFSASLSIRRTLEDTAALHKRRLFFLPLFYGIATLLYLKRFFAYYNSSRFKTAKPAFSKTVTLITDALAQNWEHRDAIQTETEELLDKNYKTPDFICKSNVFGCFYITALTLILSV